MVGGGVFPNLQFEIDEWSILGRAFGPPSWSGLIYNLKIDEWLILGKKGLIPQQKSTHTTSRF